MSAPDRTWDIPQSQPNPAVVPPAPTFSPGAALHNPYKWPIPVTGSGPQNPPTAGNYPWGLQQVQPPEPPPVVSDLIIYTTTLVSGNVGQNYFASIQAGLGTPPYNWTSSGASWVSTFPSGAQRQFFYVTGTPDAEGTYNLTVTLTDSAVPPASVSRVFSIPIGPALPLVNNTPEPLPTAFTDQYYWLQLDVTGGVPPYTWTSNYLPAWTDQYQIIFMQGGSWTDGVVSGTPTEGYMGDTVDFTVTDSVGNTVSGNYYLDVQPMAR